MAQLRFYSLCNFYLSSIQQGIQSGHALGEIVNKYTFDPGCNDNATPGFFDQRDIVRDFIQNHKTWVVLNGGAHDDIAEFLAFLDANLENFRYAVPFAHFCEDQASLNGILTCVGLILPENYFNAVSMRKFYRGSDFKPDPALVDDYVYVDQNDPSHVEEHFDKGSADWELIDRVQRCSLAR